MNELRGMVASLENKNKSKETECEHLIKYQDEFRQEYVSVCAERDSFYRRNQELDAANERMRDDISRLSKEGLDFKQTLQHILQIEDGPHCHQVIPQHA